MSQPDATSTPESPPAQDSSPSANAGILTILLHHSITVLILVLVLSLGVWGYLNFRDAEFFAAVDREQFEASLQPSLVEAQHQRMSAAIEVYSLAHERYPTHLRELVDAELLASDDLYYPAGLEMWTYQLDGESFTLSHRSTDESAEAQGESDSGEQDAESESDEGDESTEDAEDAEDEPENTEDP